jgi:uncharacterized protein YggT (Ycf19 family)
MGFIDFILNIAALLIWLNWISLPWEEPVRTGPTSLAGTLKPAGKRRLRSWQLLAGLVLLLVVRAFLYRYLLAPAAEWTPKLNLGLISLAFRADNLPLAFVFSGVGFLRILVVFYFWLLTLAIINHQTVEADSLQKLVRLHLGPIGGWPRTVQAILPFFVVALLWVLLHPLLGYTRIVAPSRSSLYVLAQGFLLGTGLIVTLKYLLPIFLCIHLVVSYVYLGNNPLWDFASLTTRNLLRPLDKLPLRVARLDFSPVIGVVILFILLDWLPKYTLARLAASNLTPWPQ